MKAKPRIRKHLRQKKNKNQSKKRNFFTKMAAPYNSSSYLIENNSSPYDTDSIDDEIFELSPFTFVLGLNEYDLKMRERDANENVNLSVDSSVLSTSEQNNKRIN